MLYNYIFYFQVLLPPAPRLRRDVIERDAANYSVLHHVQGYLFSSRTQLVASDMQATSVIWNYVLDAFMWSDRGVIERT